MIGVKKGLFGKQMPMPGVISGYGGGTFGMDGTQVTPTSMPQNMAVQDTTSLGAAGAQPRQGFDWKNVLLQTLGGAADGAATFFGGEPVIRQNMQMQQMLAMKQAEDQRKRAADLADFRTQLEIESQFKKPEGPKPGSFEWYNSPTTTDAERAAYDAYNPVVATTWQGPTIVPRSQLAPLPSRPVGGLTEIQPTIENTPAPQLGANGMPAVLSRQQYQATVNAMGKADTDAWMARNNIRVVD